MITLKKSFELQNYLKKLLFDAMEVLLQRENITTTTQEHLRHKVYDNAEDETVVIPKLEDYPFTPMELVDFACYVQQDMEKLTLAINKAKQSGSVYFDGLIANNNHKRSLMRCLSNMANIKGTEKITTGYSNKFNEEGNQVKYAYDIKEVTKIDFDRNAVKAIVSRLMKELDETSTTIDIMQLETKVDFDTIFEIGDNLEDAVMKYKDKTK